MMHDDTARGGEGGIRTLETREGLPAFQASALGHYATSPDILSCRGAKKVTRLHRIFKAIRRQLKTPQCQSKGGKGGRQPASIVGSSTCSGENPTKLTAGLRQKAVAKEMSPGFGHLSNATLFKEQRFGSSGRAEPFSPTRPDFQDATCWAAAPSSESRDAHNTSTREGGQTPPTPASHHHPGDGGAEMNTSLFLKNGTNVPLVPKKSRGQAPQLLRMLAHTIEPVARRLLAHLYRLAAVPPPQASRSFSQAFVVSRHATRSS